MHRPSFRDRGYDILWQISDEMLRNMPMPWTYRHASKEWQAFLDDAKDQMGLVSDNMAYTAVDGVLQVFRRRLTVEQGLTFASVLPTVPRAIFVNKWVPDDPPAPWPQRVTLTAEVKALRPHHNLTPDNAITATAFALRRRVDQRDLDRALNSIGPEALAYWTVTGMDPALLQQRII